MRRVRLVTGETVTLADGVPLPDGASLLSSLLMMDHAPTGDYAAGIARANVLMRAIAFDALITEKARAWATTPPSTPGMRHTQDRNPGEGSVGDAYTRLLADTARAWEQTR